uniref:Kazal-like domain-containing protein n=1 Tax=Anopheles culicifacies TaxID=139723 RepID=A0A182LT24_9DIPT
MERNGRMALVGVVLVAAAVLLAHAESSRASVVAGRVRRQSPWLHRSPNTFALSKKFARNRPLSGTTVALETNTDWPENLVERARPVQVRPLELSAEVDSKPAPRSRAFYNCMSNCLTLSQYNPVCGTDHTTYHNQYKLECANRCGAKPSKYKLSALN